MHLDAVECLIGSRTLRTARDKSMASGEKKIKKKKYIYIADIPTPSSVATGVCVCVCVCVCVRALAYAQQTYDVITYLNLKNKQIP